MTDGSGEPEVVPGSSAVRVVSAAGEGRLAAAVEVFTSTWGASRSPDEAFLTALAHAGDPVHVALAGDEVIGAAFAVLGWRDGLHLHSHMAAVVPSHRGRGVGLALKLAQRDEALAHGVREIRWTFDPLVLRNARFNLARLGARVLAFRPDFYGMLDDPINSGEHSDRFEVSWLLDSERVSDALEGRRSEPMGEGELILPPDYHALRRDRPGEAAALRARSRELLPRVLEAGLDIEVGPRGYVFVGREPR